MAEERSRIWVWVLVGGGLFVLFAVGVFTLVYMSFGAGIRKNRFPASVQDCRRRSRWRDFFPQTDRPQLKKFADDDSVKAIIIHVNSPGGGVAASEEIYAK